MRITPVFFDVNKFRECYKLWTAAGCGSESLQAAFVARLDFNKPFIEHYQKLAVEETQPHRRKAIEFWLSCLRAGIYPHFATSGPAFHPSEFLQWAAEVCPYVDEEKLTIPNLEKLNGQ